MTGGEPEQLTNDPADEFAPDLSPDGRSVTYHSWRNGTRDIEVKPLNGGPIELVTATPEQESYPRWSPDGRSIAYYNQVTPSLCTSPTETGTGDGRLPPCFGRGRTTILVARRPHHRRHRCRIRPGSRPHRDGAARWRQPPPGVRARAPGAARRQRGVESRRTHPLLQDSRFPRAVPSSGA